ncbi:hypothetical protein RUM44_004405 [Polyplax serrata]|uniref:Beta-1,4-N-acetylgalactosaminyltransferase n=1 Tax=Polyplax serrata TaxID=468196 RepID=A0ABR1B4F0_POLSC
MTLYVRLKGPQVTLLRRKRGFSLTRCPRIRRRGLLPSLSLMFLSIAIASVGFFIVTEVKIAQRLQVDGKFRHSSTDHSTTTSSPRTNSSGEFKIMPLIDKAAPSVELAAQLTLNNLYSLQIKRDILSHYNWNRCRRLASVNSTAKSTGECKRFTLTDKSIERTKWWTLKSCSLYPSDLEGPRFVPETKLLTISQIDPKVVSTLRKGGWWEPSTCLARHSVAIVIPYKDRWRHLTTLLNYLLPLLQRQQLRFKLFVVEQYGNETFNKGVIMNAGFKEAIKEELYHCFIFHDVDLIPENDYNMYTCPEMPRHLSIAVNEFHYKLPYVDLVGGAFAIRTDHFFRVNGFSNFFWGWGGEDDDMGIRISQVGLNVIRPLPNVGRYTMIKHVKRKPSEVLIRRRLLFTARKRFRFEGLNSVQYKLIKKIEYPWFTNILVDIGKPHPSFKTIYKPIKTTNTKNRN